ncbi:hypothetical protein PG993_003566 [Apiospora rasikravindrae]|uniref:Uncharacterized protein n=1 Tax=Apiospora rasikravindrae TaxID=990691 RepID=A0ABR1TZW3_9PEZI
MAFRSTLRSQQDDFTTQKGIANLVAVANDDDLLDFLYVDGNHHHADSSKIIINHVIEPLHEDDLTPFSNPSTGLHTPEHEEDEDAVLSDIPSESEEDLEIPPSPPTPQRRHRGATSVGEDDFEFPVFLGRQCAEETQQPSATRPPFQRANDTQSVAAAKKAVQFHEPDVPADHHVVSVDGPVMSWWPAPIDTLEYDWVVKNQRAAEDEQQRQQEPAAKKIKTVAVESHVADLEGPLMAWWPAPAELLEYDWFERFYE